MYRRTIYSTITNQELLRRVDEKRQKDDLVEELAARLEKATTDYPRLREERHEND